MVKTRSMTRNQNHDDDHASSRNRSKTRNKRVVATWSDLNHDLLLLVMMRLGVVDLVAFSGVCKSWRSFALSDLAYKEERYLKDFEGRKFKTIIPCYSAGWICFGLTCGYLILFGRETKDFWLVNPITRHQLHFPNYVHYAPSDSDDVRAILVFSPSIKGWVFVMAFYCRNDICFSIAGKGVWNHVSTASRIHDLHAFKGKIYTIDIHGRVCEWRLNREPTLTSLVKIKNFPKNSHYFYMELVSSGENLYAINPFVKDSNVVYVFDFGKMKWVMQKEKRIAEYVLFLSAWRKGAAIKPESWVADPSSLYKSPKDVIFAPNKWYFPLLCLEVDLIN